MTGELTPAVTGAWVLAIVALVQTIFLLLLVAFLVVRRSYDRHQRAALLAARGGIDAPLKAWLVAGASPDPVVHALRALPHGTAVGYLSLLARRMLPKENRDELAHSLRGERWVASAIAQAASGFWWRRLEAARALALVATPRDQGAVLALLEDTHPAVQVAAAAAVPRIADADALGRVFALLPALPKVVRHFLPSVMRDARQPGGAALARSIDGDASPESLCAWIDLASAIDDAGAVAAAARRASHPDASVRRSVARALGRRPGPDSLGSLRGLLADDDAEVRAAATRTLGELAGAEAVPAIAPMLADRAWTVRMRAAIALAQCGERGRALLRAEREGPDKFGRDMAAMVSGLSDGALLELGD